MGGCRQPSSFPCGHDGTLIMYRVSRMSDDPTKKHAEEIRRIARKHGALRVRVFGSFATGSASSSSDVDFLVQLEPGRDLLDLVALKQDLEALLGRSVDVAEEDALSPYMRDKILQEAGSL